LALAGTNGVQLVWGSASNRVYTIQRANALSNDGANWTDLSPQILSTPPLNTWMDTTVTNGSQFYYRLRAQSGFDSHPVLVALPDCLFSFLWTDLFQHGTLAP
jgi:hypothetical protein